MSLWLLQIVMLEIMNYTQSDEYGKTQRIFNSKYHLISTYKDGFQVSLISESK